MEAGSVGHPEAENLTGKGVGSETGTGTVSVAAGATGARAGTFHSRNHSHGHDNNLNHSHLLDSSATQTSFLEHQDQQGELHPPSSTFIHHHAWATESSESDHHGRHPGFQLDFGHVNHLPHERPRLRQHPRPAPEFEFEVDSYNPQPSRQPPSPSSGSGAADGHDLANVIPDEFYQSHQGLHSFHDQLPTSTGLEYMANSGTSISSRPRGTSFSRPDTNGSPSQHATTPSANSNNVRPNNTRSVSAPIEPAAAARSAAAAKKFSVKDLTKKFDQNAPGMAQRSPGRSGIPTRANRAATSGDKLSPSYHASGNARTPQTSYSVLRSSVDRDLTSESNGRNAAASRTTQRPKFVPEDQMSNNAQSFASRIGKPPNTFSANAHASKSITNLSPAPHPPPSAPSIDTYSTAQLQQTQGLLFGEILPEHSDSRTVGFGIDGSGSRPRRTSESNLQTAKPAHQRSLSDPDMLEPPSPTDWYRIANPQSFDQPPQAPASTSVDCSEAPGLDSSAQPVTDRSVTGATSPTSRLPVSVRKSASPAPSSSSPSGENSRANSPTNVKRPAPNDRGSRTGNNNASRAKTPTQTAPRKTVPRLPITPNENTRLNAYVGPPAPKLSPPLRSSRPRQSVATATTASSRMRAADRAKSPHQRALQNAPKPSDPAVKGRKISIGPVDFEQRREHIRLAYSKSIRDTQAREARQQAAEKRKRELEAAAKAKAAALAASQTRGETLSQDDASPLRSEIPRETSEASDGVPPGPSAVAPATVTTASPILEIPGSFPTGSPALDMDVAPPSAISVATETTEFDTEPQTLPPVPGDPDPPSAAGPDPSPAGLGVTASDAVDGPSEEVQNREASSSTPSAASPALPEKVEYKYPFGEAVKIEGLARQPADLPAAQSISTAQTKAEYKYPFGEESIDRVAPPIDEATVVKKGEYKYPFGQEQPKNDRVPTRVSVDEASEPKVSPPTPQETFLGKDSGETAGQGDLVDNYEPNSHASPPLETTVKILRRDSDQEDSSQETTPFPRADHHEGPIDDSGPDHGEARIIRRFTQDAEQHMLPVSAEVAGGNERSEAPSPIQPRDTMSSHRASTCDSDSMDDMRRPSQPKQQQTPDTSHSQVAPSLSTYADQNNRQSTWTDFSLESNETSDDHVANAALYDEDMPLPLPNPPFAAESRYHRQTPSETSSGRQSGYYSSDVSPLESWDAQSLVSAGEHQLPEIDTGEGFSVSYLSHRASRRIRHEVPLPEYDPPPVPATSSASINESRRPPSSTYQTDTRPGSTLISSSERGSDDVALHVSTPHSFDHMSFDVRDSSLSSHTAVDSDQKLSAPTDSLSDKERHRLLQRRNIIKEMVDTEMVFVRDMNIVEEIYLGTAEACPKLDDNTIKLIFRNVDQIVGFHTAFSSQLKEAVAPIYAPQARRSANTREESIKSDSTTSQAGYQTPDLDDAKDRAALLGPLFHQNMEKMKAVHEGFLRSSDHAAKRLIQIQQDPTVQVWLNECYEVAKDLTAAWDLDSLLIKPMQRITKYPNLIMTLLQHTPQDHPDRAGLTSAKEVLESAIIEINKTKKNFELVGQIVGRKRKESDVKAGFARAFGKRVDKLQASGTRIPDDETYAKLHEKFGDDYLRLQVVLRDVEFYTRQVSTYVHEFLQYLSSMELVMRLQPGSYPELESKWVQFNVSMRDIEKFALEQHVSNLGDIARLAFANTSKLAQVRKQVIEPFELVIKAYGNPSLAMKKREKRRLDYERAEQLKKGGKSIDSRLQEQVDQYEALNETLKKELPKLSALTEKVGNICLGNLVNIQASWFSMWKDKVKVVLEDSSKVPEVSDIVSTFQRDYKFAHEQIQTVGILNPAYKGRASQSTTTTRASTDDGTPRSRHRPPELSPRERGRSINNNYAPVLPTPDFAKRHSGQFMLSPSNTAPSPHQYNYRDYYAGINGSRQSGPSGTNTPATGEQSPHTRSGAPTLGRPSTGRSYDSIAPPRQSSDSSVHRGRDSGSSHTLGYTPSDARRYSGLFHSALPMQDPAEDSRRSSRASSRERGPTANGYNVLWLAASLFEFNIETTKHEAGYPYLTYQAGEIFDVVAEKGELWLAKNQDDPTEQVGWIWSKHFAKLADS